MEPPFVLNKVAWGGDDVPWLPTASLCTVAAVGDSIPDYALASSYLWEPDYIASAIPVLAAARAGVILCGDSPDVARALRAAFPRLSVETPTLPLFGSNHSKFVLVFHSTHLRIIIASGNFIQRDYEYKTQSIFTADCPACATPVPCDFALHLNAYVRHLAAHGHCSMEETLRRMPTYDMSAISAHLVTSVPGSHSGEQLFKFGHMRMRQLLRSHAAGSCRHHLLLQCSSFKSGMTDEWLSEVSDSMCAHSARASAVASLFASVASPGKRLRDEASSSSSAAAAPPPAGANRVQFLWPTARAVKRSVEGWSGGGSLPVRAHHFNPCVTSRLFQYDGRGSRSRSVPHIKTMAEYAVEEDEDGGQRIILPWVYTGSHNVSAAALGRLQSKGATLKVLSYEMGVLLFPRDVALRRDAHAADSGMPGSSWPSECVFTPASAQAHGQYCVRRTDDGRTRTYIPIALPYELPPRRYGPEDLPFAVDVRFEGVDGHAADLSSLSAPQSHAETVFRAALASGSGALLEKARGR